MSGERREQERQEFFKRAWSSLSRAVIVRIHRLHHALPRLPSRMRRSLADSAPKSGVGHAGVGRILTYIKSMANISKFRRGFTGIVAEEEKRAPGWSKHQVEKLGRQLDRLAVRKPSREEQADSIKRGLGRIQKSVGSAQGECLAGLNVRLKNYINQMALWVSGDTNDRTANIKFIDTILMAHTVCDVFLSKSGGVNKQEIKEFQGSFLYWGAQIFRVNIDNALLEIHGGQFRDALLEGMKVVSDGESKKNKFEDARVRLDALAYSLKTMAKKQ
jgi:hypothetical protein